MDKDHIRVLLVDDQYLFREGICMLITKYDEIEVVGEASNGQEAVGMAMNLKPDVILMDLRMPMMDGIAATKLIHDQLPQCSIIILTTFDDDEDVFDGLRAGAIGYLLKNTPVERLVDAIRSAAHGESFLQPSIASKVVAEFNRINDIPHEAMRNKALQLSERELEVLRMLGMGKSNREIGKALFIAEGTAKNHVSNVLAKLHLHDRGQAAIAAREMHLV